MGQRLAVVLAAFAVLLVALAASLRADAFFVGDPGIKLIVTRNALRFPTAPLDIPLPVIGTEPVPHVEPFFSVHGTHAHAVTTQFFPLATAPLLALFGLRGLYVWPALGFLGAVGACAWLARVLDSRRDGATVATTAAIGTPLLFYGLEFWEHTPALAAGTAGAALLLDAARRAPGRHSAVAPTVASGFLFGLAIMLRPEAAWFAVGVAVASRTLVHRPSWRSLLVAAAGAVAAVAPLEIHTLWHFGTLVPGHLAANAGLVSDGWLAARLRYGAAWLLPSGWSLGGPSNPASFWSVTPVPLVAVASVLRTPDREERRFLWVVAGLFVLLVLLTAPNDGGGQWGPRYLLFAYVPLSILAADAVQALMAPAPVRARYRPRFVTGRPARVAAALLLLASALWAQRAAYRQLRGTKAAYGTLVDFVAAAATPDGQVVTDVWWLDQLAAPALGGQNVLFAGDSEVGAGILRRLDALAVPTVTVVRSREQGESVGGWNDGTCYVEERRDELAVRRLVAVRLTHRCSEDLPSRAGGLPSRMRYRRFGRVGWEVSEIGYGMWGMGSWSGSDDEESLTALGRAIVLGCTFFDTAWAYGQGKSERLLGEARRRYPHAPMRLATKIPPKNLRWPARAEYPVSDAYPAHHIREYTEKSLRNLDIDVIDLQQFHVWSDAWATDEGWQRAVRSLKDEGLIRAFGISVNRWEPTNVMGALQTGLVDSVQVVYNIFDQAPEDELFPYCQTNGIAVIARVPFDEGSLTGTLRADARWPESDWRNTYFTPEALADTLARVERLDPLVPEGMNLPELALRFILEHPAVSTTIPGMRRPAHVERNLVASDGVRLPPRLRDALRLHRWDRTPDHAQET